MPDLHVIHEMAKDEVTGRVVFVLEHGIHRLIGQVASEAEYRNHLAAFEAWNKVKLPPAEDGPALAALGVGRE